MKLRLLLHLALFAVQTLQVSAAADDREAVFGATLAPYSGPSIRGGDPSTLSGKLMCGPGERFATDFVHADGRKAEIFSSFNKATVLRHFQWMRDYGIDGAFVQRFIASLGDPKALWQSNAVLSHCREGANRFGRTYAVMYDLSGLGADRMQEVMDDWVALRARMRITDDPAYLHHRGRPSTKARQFSNAPMMFR